MHKFTDPLIKNLMLSNGTKILKIDKVDIKDKMN